MKAARLALVVPIALGAGALAARALLEYAPASTASGFAQPVAVVTNWHAFGAILLATLALATAIGGWAYPFGASIHFGFALAWGVLFAAMWPSLRRRGYEATFVALFYAVVAWIVMHVAISIASNDHPNYHDPVVIIGGFMSHIFFAVPMALVIKRLLSPTPDSAG